MASLLQRTCLRPNYSLRRQLLLSFGSAAFLTLAVVVVLACTSAYTAGTAVQDQSKKVMQQQVILNMLSSSRYVAERYTSYMQNFEGTVQLVAETVQDRIVNYPNEGWESDDEVPFRDKITGRNIYPIVGVPPQLDWNLTVNINASNAAEHLQERANWIKYFPESSMVMASWMMQGVCDPTAKNVSDHKFFPNCTAANNDVATGGVVAPTSTSKALYDKSGELGLLLKPLYESQGDALLLGIYYVNEGAGASVTVPGVLRKGADPPYVSNGCDYLLEHNPYTGRSWVPEGAMRRNCRPNGTLALQRTYNPVERPWFGDFVKHYSQVRWFGPFLANDNGIPLLTVGRAILDRVSHELIGCAVLDLSIADLSRLLVASKLHDVSQLALVRLDGVIVVDSLGTVSTFDAPLYLWDVNLASKASFDKLYKSIMEEIDDDEANHNYKGTHLYENDIVLAAHPVPVPPPSYDRKYRPAFLIVHKVDGSIFADIEEANAVVSDDLAADIVTTVAIGVVGMLTVLVIVWVVSRALTRPLLWMERVAWRIVNHSDERVTSLNLNDDENKENESTSATVKCAPKTEIDELVTEFRIMIRGFSGEGAATPADPLRHEILNEMTWQSDFKQLYSRVHSKRESFRATSATTNTTTRTDEDSPLTVEPNDVSAGVTNSQREDAVVGRFAALSDPWNSLEMTPKIIPAPLKQNRGSNLMPDYQRRRKVIDDSRIKAYRSSLFWWIDILIILPLLFTNVLICSIVSGSLVTRVPEWVEQARNVSVGLELGALVSIASSKAGLTSLLLFEPLRDLHFFTRVASWLFFDGINRADSFTEAVEATSECKTYPAAPDMTCPYFASSLSVCACDWHDPQDPGICKNYTSDPRFLQRRMFMANSIDVDLDTGDFQAATLFPEFWDSANTTDWFHDPLAVPGNESGANASGFATMYDRLRVASALAIVEFPIYNYKPDLGRQMHILASGLGMEADGIYQGYPGCDATFTSLAHWSSTSDNRAAELNELLCPLGKYGYDPRCRPWYATGKENYRRTKDPVYVTPPYTFANMRSVALSATSPVTNPVTGAYAGQTLIDFWPSSVRAALERVPQPLSFLITAEDDVYGGNTVVGPNKSAGWRSAPIGELLFTQGESDAEYRMVFEREILPQMQNGTSNVVRFLRSSGDPLQPEILRMAFDPVYERGLSALDPSDYSRGVKLSFAHVYTLAIATVEQNVTAPFDALEDDVNADFNRLKWTYVSLAIVVTSIFIVLSFWIMLAVTRPMITLLHIVQTINMGRMDDDVPPLEGGSTEVRQVYSSFAKLNKTVRVSNVAFFSGNVQWAFHFLSDALGLFRKINDRKAIAVASNNLGNACYAWLYQSSHYTTLGDLGDEAGIISMALQRYDEAIEVGREGFEECDRDDVKADYAQQLADRFFNRGLFLLLVKDSPDAPEGAQELGFADIKRAHGMDIDVRDFWLEHKLLLRNSDVYFDRLIRRIHGLADFYDEKSPESVWDIKQIIDDADRLLFAAWNEPCAPLFDAVTRVGRLQQLEAAVIRVERRMGNIKEAARLAMRMFAEDEYLLESCFWSAAGALVQAMGNEDTRTFSSKTVSIIRSDIRKMLMACKSVSLDIGKCVVFGFEITERWEGDNLWEEVNDRMLTVYDACCHGIDHVGLVAYTSKGDLNLPLEQKASDAVRQRSLLDIASASTSEKAFPAFPLAVQMLVEATASAENDSYVVLLADGFSWDSESHSSIRWQIERLNRERSTKINIIVLGFDVENDFVIEQCKSMCTVTKSSFYAEVTSETIDTVFEQVMSALSGPLSGSALQGLTMQKF